MRSQCNCYPPKKREGAVRQLVARASISLSNTPTRRSRATRNASIPFAPAATSTATLKTNEGAYFGVYVVGQGTYIPFDIANNRVYIQAQQSGTPIAQASVAVRINSTSRANAVASR
jgi:hypothetical protein